MNKPTYTAKDAGCYVDSARGIYAPGYIVDFAIKHGLNGGQDITEETVASFDDEGEAWNALEDQADDYMNEHYAVDGHFWGRNDNGDWGLWATDDEDDADEDASEPEPDEGDITTTDDEHWYQFGKLYHTGDRASLVAKMDADQFWPNVFTISDHGNAHLISLCATRAGN